MRQFLANPTLPYIGGPFSSPVSICEPSKDPPVVVPFIIQWLSYGAGTSRPNVNVSINVKQAGTHVQMDKVKSVYIDNLNNNVPVYVFFPDTGYTIACQPNAQGWFTALSNSFAALICGVGFTDADSNAQTYVAFSNTNPPPIANIELAQNVALYRASPAIQRGNTIYNSRYAPPALGDQIIQAVAPCNSLAGVNIWPVQSSGYWVITSMDFTALLAQAGATQTSNIRIASTGVSGLLIDFGYVQFGGIVLEQKIYSISSMQLKIDATQQWQLVNFKLGTSGFVQATMTYTYLVD